MRKAASMVALWAAQTDKKSEMTLADCSVAQWAERKADSTAVNSVELWVVHLVAYLVVM